VFSGEAAPYKLPARRPVHYGTVIRLILRQRRTSGQLTALIAFAISAWPQSPPWADEMLRAHNSLRSHLHLPPLVWSDKAATAAHQWAEALLARNQFTHRPNSAYGENLFEIGGADASPTQVVSEWASEAHNYDYASNRCKGVCGHYTQLVWRDTKELGCGVARSASREIWVCDYSPPGNWVGRRPF
jgi:pathogenesis-related protein 1